MNKLREILQDINEYFGTREINVIIEVPKTCAEALHSRLYRDMTEESVLIDRPTNLDPRAISAFTFPFIGTIQVRVEQ